MLESIVRTWLRLDNIMYSSLWKGRDRHPVGVGTTDDFWPFHDHVLLIEPGVYTEDELAILIKREVLLRERALKIAAHNVEMLERADALPLTTGREAIPPAVRIFVWRRDSGACVECGAREKLEFDHIIPVSLGGSSTERNVQLLCEPCNRSKGAAIG